MTRSARHAGQGQPKPGSDEPQFPSPGDLAEWFLASADANAEPASGLAGPAVVDVPDVCQAPGVFHEGPHLVDGADLLA